MDSNSKTYCSIKNKEWDKLVQRHIFISIHPMSNLYINEIIRKEKLTNYLVLEIYKQKIISNMDNIVRFHYQNIFQYFKQLNNARKLIDSNIKKYPNVSFYIPHPMHIITNYIVFSIKNRSINLIPDGILNYYDYPSYKYRKQMLCKKAFAFLLRINYKLFNGHFTAYDVVNYEKIYTIYKKGMITIGENIVEIKLKSKKQNNSLFCLILGSPIDQKKISTYLSIVKEEIAILSNKKMTIFYKYHPSEKENNKLKLLLSENNISILNSKEPIESLCDDFAIIIAPASSSLINLKLIYHSQIDCISYMPSKKINQLFNINEDVQKNLRDVFKRIGVIVYE